jgi:D-alanyl-D-alanine carboxypeptidase/D-alanyl-D-alanine-endopeptidase (penicillin-binding protein 4)
LSLEENATCILKVSYNRGAQTQVCMLAASVGSTDCDDGFPEMAKVLTEAGLVTKQASLVDGPGLPGNFVTGASVTQLMQVLDNRPDAQRWMEAMPIMGVDGSVAEVQKDSPAAGRVYAKTGTLGAGDLLNQRLRVETKALGGYIEAKSGRKLAMAIIVNQAMFDDIEGVFAANEDLGKIATSLYEAY